jgi:hypothetical protein
MTNVNEYNVETNELIVRQYTQEEEDQIAADALMPKEYIVVDNSLTKAEMEQVIIQQLMSLGVTEEKAREIIGL